MCNQPRLFGCVIVGVADQLVVLLALQYGQEHSYGQPVEAGPALFEALVTLCHNSGLIARWVDGEEADAAAVALLAQELSSQAQDVVERNEVASAIRAVKL